jgi:hypothetical protein
VPDFTNVSAALRQMLGVLQAIHATDAQLEQLDAAVEMLQGGHQLQPEQMQLFQTQYAFLQEWQRRGKMDRVGRAIIALLRAIGV